MVKSNFFKTLFLCGMVSAYALTPISTSWAQSAPDLSSYTQSIIKPRNLDGFYSKQEADAFFQEAANVNDNLNRNIQDAMSDAASMIADGVSKESAEYQQVLSDLDSLYLDRETFQKNIVSRLIASQKAGISSAGSEAGAIDMQNYQVPEELLVVDNHIPSHVEDARLALSRYEEVLIMDRSLTDITEQSDLALTYGEYNASAPDIYELKYMNRNLHKKKIDTKQLKADFETYFHGNTEGKSFNDVMSGFQLDYDGNNPYALYTLFSFLSSYELSYLGDDFSSNAFANQRFNLIDIYSDGLGDFADYDGSATDNFTRFIQKRVDNLSSQFSQHQLTTYLLSFDGQPFTLFVNRTTGRAIGYGSLGFDEIDVQSFMDYGEGVFIGTYNTLLGTVTGEFLGISGSETLSNDYQIDPGNGLGGNDAVGLRFTNFPSLNNVQDGGNISATILVGDPANAGNNIAVQIPYSVRVNNNDAEPYKLHGAYGAIYSSSTEAVTQRGYGFISSQDRLSDTIRASTVMDDLGDLTVVTDRANGSDSMSISINGVTQASTRNGAVSDKVAASINKLGDNALRTGVMFPLDEVDNVNLVHFVDFADGLLNASPTTIGYGFGVVGENPTDLADMPVTGTATYTGGTAGYYTEENPFNAGEVTSVEQFYGDTNLIVNFGTNAVTGNIATFRHNNNAAMSNFNVTGNVAGAGLNINVNDGAGVTGTGTGSFYGDAAAEVAGQFSASGGNVQYEGVFWGKQ